MASNQPGVIEPYDVMQYEQSLTEFLTAYCSDEELQEYPLSNSLRATRDMINRFFRTGRFEFSRPVRNITVIGRTIDGIAGLEVVSPDRNTIKKGIEEVFAERLLKEENLWEVLYELEIAHVCKSNGFNTELIHEGADEGPDIFVNLDDQRIDIECKKRRTGNTGQDNESEVAESILNEISDRMEFDTDNESSPELSYYLEISSNEPLLETAIDQIVDEAINVLSNEKSESTITVAGTDYKISLEDHFYGEVDLDITTNDLDSMMEYLNERHIDMFLSPFDTNNFSPNMSASPRFYVTEDGSVMGKGIHVVNINSPTIDEEYHSRVIEGTIKKGLGDLSGREPSVLFVSIPAYELEDMTRYMIDGYQGDRLLQAERLDQMIEGKLKQSGSVNAIVLTATYFENQENKGQLSRGYKVFENADTRKELPSEFREFLRLS